MPRRKTEEARDGGDEKAALVQQAQQIQKKCQSRAARGFDSLTYETECGLDGIADLVDDPSIAPRLPIDSDTVPVYVDLETTGLSKNTCEITQLAARCADDVFSVYVLPTKGISKAASIVTGLTTSGGELFKNGELLVTTPPKKAFFDFIAFLKSRGQRVLLVAHNGNSYDAPILLREARKQRAMAELLTVVAGFVDTLEVMKAHLPQRKESFKLGSLALLYDVESDNAHDAAADVKMLQEIVAAAGVPYATLLRHSKTVQAIVQNEERLARRSLHETSLQPLKPIVTPNMIKKIANAGISLTTLQAAYNQGAERGVEVLLRESVNNKARVTIKSKVADIIRAVKITLE